MSLNTQARLSFCWGSGCAAREGKKGQSVTLELLTRTKKIKLQLAELLTRMTILKSRLYDKQRFDS